MTFPLPTEYNGYTVIPTEGMNHVVANLVKGNKTISLVRTDYDPNRYNFVNGMKVATIKGVKSIEIRENGRIWEFEQ